MAAGFGAAATGVAAGAEADAAELPLFPSPQPRVRTRTDATEAARQVREKIMILVFREGSTPGTGAQALNSRERIATGTPLLEGKVGSGRPEP